MSRGHISKFVPEPRTHKASSIGAGCAADNDATHFAHFQLPKSFEEAGCAESSAELSARHVSQCPNSHLCPLRHPSLVLTNLHGTPRFCCGVLKSSLGERRSEFDRAFCFPCPFACPVVLIFRCSLQSLSRCLYEHLSPNEHFPVRQNT